MAKSVPESPQHVLAPVLSYARGTEGVPTRVRRWIVCVLYIPGLFVPFLDFTYGVSPVDALKMTFEEMLRGSGRYDGLWLIVLAIGLLMPMPMWPWLLRLAMSRGIGLIERRMVRGVAMLLALATLALCIRFAVEAMQDRHWEKEMLWLLAAPFVLIVYSPFLWISRHRNAYASTLLWMHTAYLANVTMALGIFAEDRDPGWYVTLGLAGVSVLDTVMVTLWRD